MLKQAADNSGAPLKERFPARSQGKQHFPRIAPFSSPLMLIPSTPQVPWSTNPSAWKCCTMFLRVCGREEAPPGAAREVQSLFSTGFPTMAMVNSQVSPRRRRSQIFADGHQQLLKAACCHHCPISRCPIQRKPGNTRSLGAGQMEGTGQT